MPLSSFTINAAAKALTAVGVVVDPSAITIEPRQERWLVRLPNERLAWFATSSAGCEVLRVDRSVLRSIEGRCSFQAPRILVEAENGDFDVRSMVPGASDPQRLYSAACSDARLAERIGESIGKMLSELHTKIRLPDVDPGIQRRPSWPESREWILDRLPRVVNDRRIIAAADEVMCRCEEVKVAEWDRVLIHGDLGMHALAYDPQTFHINGLFDFEGAAIADRHHDFRYLSPNALDAAVMSYGRFTGLSLDRERIHLYAAACALSYLAFRDGHGPDENWCGRTLEEDLKWAREAADAIA